MVDITIINIIIVITSYLIIMVIEIMMNITMRRYLLTERERDLIHDVIDDRRPNGFRVLKHLAEQSLPQIEADLALLKQFLRKVSTPR